MKIKNIMRTLCLGVISMLSSTALADNVLSVGNANVVPGEITAIPVVLENTDVIANIQFNVELTGELQLDSAARDYDRVSDETHAFYYTADKVVIFENKTANIAGNSGAIAYLYVAAPEDFQGGTITLTNIKATGDAAVEAVAVEVTAGEAAEILAVGGSFSMDEAAQLAVGKTADVNIYLNNTLDITTFDIQVQLPECVELVNVQKGDRLSSNDNAYVEYAVDADDASIVNITMNNDLLNPTAIEAATGEEGAVIVLTVKGTAVATDAVITGLSGNVQNNSLTYGLENEETPTTVLTIDILGDVNSDGTVSTADANAIINAYTSGEVPTSGFNVVAADVNGDDNISTADANEIVNMFVNE